MSALLLASLSFALASETVSPEDTRGEPIALEMGLDGSGGGADVPVVKFHTGRFIAEIVGGTVVGGALAYGTYAGICRGEPCLGGVLAGTALNLGATPLAIWVIGAAFKGHGNLGKTYLGAVLPFGVSAPTMALAPNVALAIGFVLMPVTGALFYEMSSNQSDIASGRARMKVIGLDVAPLGDEDRRLAGGTVTVNGIIF